MRTTDPLAYRVLMILPVIYRKWASARLADLVEWIAEWQTEHMFAGIPAFGAEDAWLGTALHIEECMLQGKAFSGAATDIMKCFDQVSRRLVKKILQAAGLPPHILDAYMRFQESLNVFNAISGGLGKPYCRPYGIPQGCPLSMTIIALLLRPWLFIVLDRGSTPRV